MTETQYNQNQTQFGSDAPILEQPVQTVEPVVVSQPSWWRRQPKWLISLMIGLGGLIIIVLIIALSREPSPPPAEKVSETETELKQLTPLQERLETARGLLRQANPTVQELPFPPVDTTLRIDKAR